MNERKIREQFDQMVQEVDKEVAGVVCKKLLDDHKRRELGYEPRRVNLDSIGGEQGKKLDSMIGSWMNRGISGDKINFKIACVEEVALNGR